MLEPLLLYFQTGQVLGLWVCEAHVGTGTDWASLLASEQEKGKWGFLCSFNSQGREKASEMPRWHPILSLLYLPSPTCTLLPISTQKNHSERHLSLQIGKLGEFTQDDSQIISRDANRKSQSFSCMRINCSDDGSLENGDRKTVTQRNEAWFPQGAHDGEDTACWFVAKDRESCLQLQNSAD